MKRFFMWIERKVFLGEVLKDYGILDERNFGIARLRTSLLLCRRKGKVQLVFRNSGVAIMSASVSYVQVDATPEALARLNEIVLDASKYLAETMFN